MAALETGRRIFPRLSFDLIYARPAQPESAWREELRRALALAADRGGNWLAEADLMLSSSSWDTTYARMAGLIAEALGTRVETRTPALLVAAE